MLPIVGFFATQILPVIGGAGWSRFIAKRISDHIISGKIGEIVEEVREKIKYWYYDYSWNMVLTIILNVIIIGITLVSHYLFAINVIIICIISVISILMILRTLVRFIKSIVQTIIPNWHNIIHYTNVFFYDLFDGYGISGSIRDTIHVAFSTLYHNNTNSFTRGVHTVFSKLGFIKSEHEISEEVQDEFYSLITGYTVRLIIYKIIAFTAYILVFNFLLRPLIFSYTLKLNFFQLAFYPFTVAIPRIITIIKDSL